MTFRELLDKYRAGQASEEERALVEAELEKSEAIADYLAEQVEDALGAAETQAPAGEVRHIQKKVNRRLRRTAVWAACIVLAVLLGVRFVVSPLVSSLYYQPNAYTVGGMEDRAPDSLVEENGVEVIDLDDMLEVEVAQGAVLGPVLAHDGLDGGGDEEILLLEAQGLALVVVVLGVEHLGDGLGHGPLLHGFQILAGGEQVHVHRRGAVGVPQAEQVAVLGAVAGDQL